MKNRIIRDRFAALTVLSQRTLPSSSAINKVTALMTSRFKPANDVISRRINEVLAEHPVLDENASSFPIALLERRQRATEAVMDEAQPIKKIPDHMRLTSADMPKPLKGDDGWKNADEITAIRISLGTLYAWGSDEKFVDNEKGEELDEDSDVERAAAAIDEDPHSTAAFEEK